MKKFRLICVVIALLTLFCACNNGSDNGDGSGSSVTRENPAFAEFQIVRPDSASQTVQEAMAMVNKTIREKTGNKPALKTDFEAELAYEILIGETNRAASTAALETLEVGDFVVKTVATDTAVKLVVLGATDEMTVRAAEKLCEMIENGEVIDASGKIQTLSVAENYYARYENYHLEISDPTVVYQSPADMKQSWGYYQFPMFSVTADGDLMAHWAYSEDHVLGGGGSTAAIKWAISKDGGKTWTAVSDADISKYPLRYGGVETESGKQFVSFKGANSVSVPASSVTAKVYAGGTFNMWFGTRQVRIYMASEIESLMLMDGLNLFKINEYNPATKNVESREVTVNWPYMAVSGLVEGNNIVLSAGGRAWEISGTQNMIRKDGVLYYVVYGNGFDSSASSAAKAIMNGKCYYNSVYVFSSVDGGDTWNYLSQISTKDIPNFKEGMNAEGPGEPSIGVMPDGSIVMIFRTGDASATTQAHPTYIVRSTDGCKTWSTPEKFDDLGVLPQLVTLGCGVSLSSYGRPGVFVKSTSDLSGQVWSDAIEIALSPQSPTSSEARLSCSYTDILPISDTEALLIYTDFHHPVGDGTYTKAIMIRTITVVPD